MQYNCTLQITEKGIISKDISVSVEKEGIRSDVIFTDYADVKKIRPVNHRVYLDMFDGSCVEISMLGFSYDGFWEELMQAFGRRSLESLFVEEEEIMRCEGEYVLPGKCESGRGQIALFPDAVCILPQTSAAVRIPLCLAGSITMDGYMISVTLNSGRTYQAGKMGYDTKPFFERCVMHSDRTVREREAMISSCTAKEPFAYTGLFRTAQKEEHWAAAFGDGTCAVELYTKDDAATYLYRFSDRTMFTMNLVEAMEAVGSHREIIFLPDEKIAEIPLYRMAVHRSEAVRFLRGCSAGRIIHNSAHEEKLAAFLGL